MLLHKAIHSSENGFAGVFPAVVRGAFFPADIYLLLPLAFEGSGNSCLESDLEPSRARIYSEIMVLKAQWEGLDSRLPHGGVKGTGREILIK